MKLKFILQSSDKQELLPVWIKTYWSAHTLLTYGKRNKGAETDLHKLHKLSCPGSTSAPPHVRHHQRLQP